MPPSEQNKQVIYLENIYLAALMWRQNITINDYPWIRQFVTLSTLGTYVRDGQRRTVIINNSRPYQIHFFTNVRVPVPAAPAAPALPIPEDLMQPGTFRPGSEETDYSTEELPDSQVSYNSFLNSNYYYTDTTTNGEETIIISICPSTADTHQIQPADSQTVLTNDASLIVNAPAGEEDGDVDTMYTI